MLEQTPTLRNAQPIKNKASPFIEAYSALNPKPENTKPEMKPKKPIKKQTEKKDTEPSALETFFLLADIGIKDKDKVLVQFYPDFLTEVATEIRTSLQKKGTKK
jgi:hypothetical protein